LPAGSWYSVELSHLQTACDHLVLELVGLVIVVPAVLVFVIHWIWEVLLGYAKLAIPYKWLVGYYYFIIAVPYMWADEVSRWVLKSTPWPNLNLVLRVVVFFGMFLFPYAAVIELLRRALGEWRLIGAVVLGPFLAFVIWWVGAAWSSGFAK
jgi:hypothetical protein